MRSVLPEIRGMCLYVCSLYPLLYPSVNPQLSQGLGKRESGSSHPSAGLFEGNAGVNY